jgi:hypothetical protein
VEINGADLIARIQSMVQIGLRSKHRELASQLGTIARPHLAIFGLEEKAGDLFDLFRKCKRDQVVAKRGNIGEQVPTAELFSRLLWEESSQGWGVLTQFDLRALWAKCEGEFENLLTEFNASRSQATHVLAIFRPLNEKFYLDWVASIEGFDEIGRSIKAEAIKSAKVRDRTELGIWANEMLNLFSSYTVFDSTNLRKPLTFNRELSSLVGSSKQGNPPGMISEPSERIYRQQWRLWIRENEEALLQAMHPISQMASEPMSVSSELKANPREGVSGQIQSTNETVTQVQISVTMDSDPTLTATRSWSSNRNATNEVASWLGLLSSAWDAYDDSLCVNVKFKEQEGAGEMTLRAKNFTEAPARIRGLLGALDSEQSLPTQ